MLPIRLSAARRARASLVALGAALLLSIACDSRTPLAGGASSPEALAVLVLSALEQRDAVALRRLALSEREFREHIWPELPAARPERNLPFSYVWGDLRQKSDGALASTLAEYGGRRFELVSVRATGETTQYSSFLVRRQTELTVRDEGGNTSQLRLFGSLLAKDGVYKVFSFVVDD